MDVKRFAALAKTIADRLSRRSTPQGGGMGTSINCAPPRPTP